MSTEIAGLSRAWIRATARRTAGGAPDLRETPTSAPLWGVEDAGAAVAVTGRSIGSSCPGLNVRERLLAMLTSHMGLIGFDGEAGSRYVRPELLRLVKQGTKTNANDNLALAA